MLTTLADAIDGVHISAAPDCVRAALVLLDRLRAKVVRAVGELDRGALYELDDAVSATAWLRAEGGLPRREAALTVRTATAVAALPVTDAAWADGTLTLAQVEAIATWVGLHLERFADGEAELVPLLAACTLDDTVRAMRAWRSAADDAADSHEPDEPDESVHLSDVAGRGVLRGDLAPDTLADVADALTVADSGDLDRAPAARRAEALGTVCRYFLDHHADSTPARRRPRIALVVTPEQLDTARYGVDLCDAAVHRLVTDGRSYALDYGRATRVVSARLRELLDLRDRHCRFPGCDRIPGWCDAHHVVPWEHGGPTEQANLVLLCRRHHRILHRPGYHAKLLPDATLEVTRPDGRTTTTDPPGFISPGSPVPA